MTADQPLTILGWSPTGRGVVALGVTIAIAMGVIALSVTDAPGRLLHGALAAPFIGLLMLAAAVSWLFRWIKRRPRAPRLTQWTVALALTTVANLVAMALLGLITLGMLAIGDPRWPAFLQAVVLCALLGFVFGLTQSITANVSAVRRVSPSPLSAPQA